MNDCYEIPGVARDASQDEAKKAYHKKARQLYPDYAGPESEGAFRELFIVYEALSDPEKHRLYDAGGADAPRGGASPLQDADDFSDFFGVMLSGFSGASSGPIPRRRCGADQLIGVDITLKEAVFGTQEIVSFVTYIRCGTCHGSMCTGDTQPVTYSNCGGLGAVTWIFNTMLGQMQSYAAYGACGSYGMIISSPCQECADQGRVRSHRSYPIDIPADVTEDTWTRIPNKVGAGPGDGPQGDLYLEIRELTDEVFARRRDNLHMWTTISMTTAALGTDFVLSTFDGERMVTIPVGIQSGGKIILGEPGVGRLQHPGRDNLHVYTEMEIPKKLDVRSREFLEELTTLRKKGRVEPQRRGHSMSEKLKEKFAGQ